MPNKKIPLKDKKKVIKALAMGKSYEEAKEGTIIESKNTVGLIAKEHEDEIGRTREIYLQEIEKAGVTEEKRAQKLAEALEAKKRRRDFETGEVWYEPDHKIRLDTIKYIDELKKLKPQSERSVGAEVTDGDKTVRIIFKDF